MTALSGRILTVILLVAAASGGAGEIPLAEQLAGLGPIPRLAYLRHLLEGGARDAELLFQAAVAFHELEQPDSALFYYQETIVADPGNFKAHVNMGVLLDDLGRDGAAIKAFVTALGINPDDVLALSHLAFLFHGRNDHRSAWRNLSRALEIDPAHPQSRFYLAIFFWEARMYREAIREWEAVIEAEPEGFLAARARENIVRLQKAINAPSAAGGWEPRR